MAGGLLTGKYSAENRPHGFFRRVLPRYRRRALKALQPVVQLLTEIGDRHAMTPAQVALRWLIENPAVLPIPGAKDGNQAAANARALTFALTAAESDALSDATAPWKR